jgi:hypothetical protein
MIDRSAMAHTPDKRALTSSMNEHRPGPGAVCCAGSLLAGHPLRMTGEEVPAFQVCQPGCTPLRWSLVPLCGCKSHVCERRRTWITETKTRLSLLSSPHLLATSAKVPQQGKVAPTTGGVLSGRSGRQGPEPYGRSAHDTQAICCAHDGRRAERHYTCRMPLRPARRALPVRGTRKPDVALHTGPDRHTVSGVPLVGWAGRHGCSGKRRRPSTPTSRPGVSNV